METDEIDGNPYLKSDGHEGCNHAHASLKEEDFEKDFEDFVKLGSSSQNNIDSTMLGIIIAKRLINMLSGKIEFKNVSFKYPGASENVINNITFTANPGETTAIIGSTGSGKSTLINLIPRFYDVSDGEITVSGVNVKNADIKKLRDKIGYLL